MSDEEIFKTPATEREDSHTARSIWLRSFAVAVFATVAEAILVGLFMEAAA